MQDLNPPIPPPTRSQKIYSFINFQWLKIEFQRFKINLQRLKSTAKALKLLLEASSRLTEVKKLTLSNRKSDQRDPKFTPRGLKSHFIGVEYTPRYKKWRPKSTQLAQIQLQDPKSPGNRPEINSQRPKFD